MGFKTIDLDAPGGYKRYNKLKETGSVQKAFEDEKLEETLAPRPEVKEDDNDNEKIQNVRKKEPEVKEEPKLDTSFLPLYEGKWETGELPPKQEESIEPKVSVQGVVTGVGQLRVRTKPEGDIMYLISEKSVVTILDEMEGWYKVETAPGRTGWVMKAYIKVYTEGG